MACHVFKEQMMLNIWLILFCFIFFSMCSSWTEIVTISHTVVIWQLENTKKTEGEGRPKTPSCDCILIKLILIQFSLKANPSLFLQQRCGQSWLCKGSPVLADMSEASQVTLLSSHVPAVGNKTAIPDLKRNSNVPGGPLGTRSRAEQRHRDELSRSEERWGHHAAFAFVLLLTSFLKANNAARPFWETGSGCYRSFHHRFLNFGNRGITSSHSCCRHNSSDFSQKPNVTSKPSINVLHKTREDHENEQDWIIWLSEKAVLAFCQRAGTPLILSQSPLTCTLQRQTP